MGLALGIDYALFVVSRFREERSGGREKLDAIAATGAHGEPRRALQRLRLRDRDARPAAHPEHDLPEPGRRRDPGGHHLGRRSADAAPRGAEPARRPDQRTADSDHRPRCRAGDGRREPLLGRRGQGGHAAAGPESRAQRRVPLALSIPVLSYTTGEAGIRTLPDRFASKQGFTALRGRVRHRDDRQRRGRRRRRRRSPGDQVAEIEQPRRGDARQPRASARSRPTSIPRAAGGDRGAYPPATAATSRRSTPSGRCARRRSPARACSSPARRRRASTTTR